MVKKTILLKFHEDELRDVPLNEERALFIAGRKFKAGKPIWGPTHGAIGKSITWLIMEKDWTITKLAKRLHADEEDVESYLEWYYGSIPRKAKGY
jgi:hypothetical protein